MTKGIVSLDTLNLNVKYPKSDVFRRWKVFAEGVDKHKLKQGISADGFVVRTGGSGYPLSVWQHDARAFLTDETDEKRGEGHGMGIQLQLGPKYILEHIRDLQSAVAQFLSDIGIRESWLINVTRLDLAIDVFNVAMTDQKLADWQSNWVGRSKVSRVIFNSRTGELETIYIGSRKSAIFLRIYDKVAQAIAEGDLVYWLDVWKDQYLDTVTRVEWEIKPKAGNFSKDLIDFKEFNGFSRRELLNYLVEWGRFCIPTEDENKSRWPSAPFWEMVEEITQEWADGVDWPTSRLGKTFKGISEMYIKQLAGNISGGMARLGGDTQDLANMLSVMGEYGEGLERMKHKAKNKAAVWKKL